MKGNKMSDTILITPMIVQESRCPNCNKEEDVKTVCKHCNFEYPEDDTNIFKLVGIILLCVTVCLWFIATIICWLSLNDNNSSLFEILASQWNFIINLRLW
jgi:hypothetical protein